MPRVQIVTDAGEVVGEVPVYALRPTSLGRARYGHGWDGTVFEELWAEAARRENVAAMVRESDDGKRS